MVPALVLGMGLDSGRKWEVATDKESAPRKAMKWVKRTAKM